ncbi:hypothetical protein [Nocardia altamirensis]|uniref:hypothetical protein n=1 Tax=Nocardia altamirensis TaxID=472158 RepID=UPI00114CF4DF|nr:hypothetical protein [Nocardia altamirensis]
MALALAGLRRRRRGSGCREVSDWRACDLIAVRHGIVDPPVLIEIRTHGKITGEAWPGPIQVGNRFLPRTAQQPTGWIET